MVVVEFMLVLVFFLVEGMGMKKLSIIRMKRKEW